MKVYRWKKIVLILTYFIITGCADSDNEQGYYDSGNLRYEVPLENGLRDGVLTQYYEDGSIELQSNWKDGDKHGKLVSYYGNGNVKTIEYFKDNVRVDTLKTYDSLGNVMEKFFFEQGMKEGPYFQYYQTGEIKIKGGIKDNKKHGRAETYYPNGEVKRREIYDLGKLVYSVDYTKSGVPYDISLPIVVNRIDESNKVYIGLEYSFFDDSYIGVNIGPLDAKRRLLDTLDRAKSDNSLGLVYEYSPSFLERDTLSGIIYEIHDNFVEAEYPFKVSTKDTSLSSS